MCWRTWINAWLAQPEPERSRGLTWPAAKRSAFGAALLRRGTQLVKQFDNALIDAIAQVESL